MASDDEARERPRSAVKPSVAARSQILGGVLAGAHEVRQARLACPNLPFQLRPSRSEAGGVASQRAVAQQLGQSLGHPERLRGERAVEGKVRVLVVERGV